MSRPRPSGESGRTEEPLPSIFRCREGRSPYLILGHYYVTPDGNMSDSINQSSAAIGGNSIVYAYENGDFDIVCAANSWFIPAGWEQSEDWSKPRKGSAVAAPKTAREAGVKSTGDDMLRSMRRARAKVRRLALANTFTWFVTLTLAPDQVDRYDPADIMRKVNRWADNMVRRHGLRYVLVPERHKDGAFHFHGFFAGEGVVAVDSGTISVPGHKPRRPRSEQQRAEWLAAGGHVVYNLPQWPYGYSTALELYGSYANAVAYVCKYIGKQDGERPMGRWYYSGGGLQEPHKEYAVLGYAELAEEFQGEAVEFQVPGSKMLVVHHRADCGKTVDK